MVTQVEERRQVRQVARRRARDVARTDVADSRARVNRLARAWILGCVYEQIEVKHDPCGRYREYRDSCRRV